LILCVAGEASGDALLAPIVRRLVAAGHRCVGLGGDASAVAGLELVGHARSVAAHGLVEAAGTVPALVGVGRRLVAPCCWSTSPS
jgi:lipid A disaccharide synthetase